ncbi:MAG: hypothetical protein H6568_02090 [Lewinellaceae bacterium]|nr:hypothetical protein [Saprospiraceae bacterium]MCB9311532.1 hypothetical protein [Lewinellaceae bacterium]
MKNFFRKRSALRKTQSSSKRPPLEEGMDYYMDGGYMVFTEKYHRDRGYCCQSGCRHCPYRGESTEKKASL